MLKRLSPEQIEECLAEAATSPMAAESVNYPRWYLHRWHFLPEGYLSRRSAGLYDALIRRVYNVASEDSLHAALVRRIRGHEPRAVLEVGSGPGNALARLRGALPNARLTGIDLSPFLLERARRRLPEEAVQLIHGDATELPWPERTFDAVVAQHFLGHLPRGTAPRAWREAGRVLRPGGRLYVLDHAWHPRLHAGLRPVGSQRLMGGIARLDVFEQPAMA